MNNLFKSLFLIIGICLLIVLYGIYQKQPKYQIVSSQEQPTKILNVTTGVVYLYDGKDGYEYFKDGEDLYILNLP